MVFFCADSTQTRSFALFCALCALLRSFADLLFCALLCSFCVCLRPTTIPEIHSGLWFFIFALGSEVQSSPALHNKTCQDKVREILSRGPSTLQQTKDPQVGNIPVTTANKIFPKVLRYKWEAYCNTNGGRTAIQMGGVLTVFPFPQSVGAAKALQYKYCNTN